MNPLIGRKSRRRLYQESEGTNEDLLGHGIKTPTCYEFTVEYVLDYR